MIFDERFPDRGDSVVGLHRTWLGGGGYRISADKLGGGMVGSLKLFLFLSYKLAVD